MDRVQAWGGNPFPWAVRVRRGQGAQVELVGGHYLAGLTVLVNPRRDVWIGFKTIPPCRSRDDSLFRSLFQKCLSLRTPDDLPPTLARLRVRARGRAVPLG